MPRFIKDGLTIETAVPSEAAELRRDGFKEQKARTKAVKDAESDAAGNGFDEGGELTPGLTTVTNATGRAETVTPSPKSPKSTK